MIALIVLLLGNLICFTLHASTEAKNTEALHIAQRLAAGYGLNDGRSSHLQHKRNRHLRDYNDCANDDNQGKRAIVIGASVGMGKEISKLLAADGYIVGMTARRVELLEQTQQEIPIQTYISYMDASNPDDAVNRLNSMIEEMGGLDLIVIAVTGYWDCDFDDSDWKKSLSVLTVDVVGFFALARTALNFFENQGYGHLVGFSSVDGLRGVAGCPAYSASKAFCARYLEAERNKFMQKNMPIFVTELCPGWVNSRGDLDYTEMPHAYWIESLDDATRDIMEAIKNKTHVAYITKRWEKVATLLATIPTDLYNALSARPGGGF
jgi:short-subunit dehydrogenase